MIWGSAAARDYCIPFYIILDAYYPVLNKTPIQYCNLNGLRMYYYSSKQKSQTCFHVLYRKSASLMRLQWPRKDQGIIPVSEFDKINFKENDNSNHGGPFTYNVQKYLQFLIPQSPVCNHQQSSKASLKLNSQFVQF